MAYHGIITTELVISELIDRIYLNLDKKGLPLAVFLDLSKVLTHLIIQSLSTNSNIMA